ncbi:MAG: hypothetical protein K2L54_04420, partial [Clostridiales bacterium]|nr:hypothetical protein [Clostridiales bacterium]
FAYYINKSMPSGDYELVCTVIDVTVGNHTHWWNGEVHDGSADADVVYHGFERTLVFTVTDAAIAFTLETDDNNRYAAYEWEYNAEDKAAMFASFMGKLTGETVGIVSVTRDGYWATPAAAAYYGGYQVEYNLLRMHNDNYYTSDKLELLSLIGKPDRYVVYFNITAPNHAPLTDLGEARYDYFFTVDVYTVLALPALESSSYAYTGEKIIPVIATSDLYSAEFDEDDDYINAGTHRVKFTLNDGTHYRWVDSAAVNGASVTVEFEITQAVNAWIETPDVVRWTEGKYDAKENKFIGAAKFGEIKYVITDSNDNVVYDSTKNINKLASLGAGTYIIKATVKGNDNYNGLSEAFTMRVLEKSGMPWWVILVVVLGVLLIVALVIFILWKKGVFTVLTDKLVLSIRTRATVDATIAAVRANKAAEQAQLNIAKAKAAERAAERKAKAEEERAKPAQEKAAALEEKAKAAAERAEKMRAKSEAMRARAERLRAQAIENEAQIDKKVEELKAESAAPQAEAAATEVATNESVDTPSEE